MVSDKPVVVVTGIAGNLGSRLLPLLGQFAVIGVDVSSPQTDLPLQFERLDLGEESSTRVLYELLRDTRPVSVIHLAFVIDPVRSGVLDAERMWQINVAGTARVMEAITEANRTADSGIKQFIFPSSVSVYGPSLPRRPQRNLPWRRIPCPMRSTRNSATKWCSSDPRRCAVAAYTFCGHTFLPERA